MKRDGLYHVVLFTRSEPATAITIEPVRYNHAARLRLMYRSPAWRAIIVPVPENEYS